MKSSAAKRPYTARGTEAPWYRGWDLTDAERERFRQISLKSLAAKMRAAKGECDAPKHPIPTPTLDPMHLMPKRRSNGLRALSLFSGCGGLDLGFERAGYEHIASYDVLPIVGEVLKAARPHWKVFAGESGDVTLVDWRQYRGKVDVVHGGPPCQPFSHAGSRRGSADVRDMIPEFARAVLECLPRAFVCENVSGLASRKFASYLRRTIFDPLGVKYQIRMFTLEAGWFGIPQRRKRVFIVGFIDKKSAARFREPSPTHDSDTLQFGNLPRTMGAREALGLSCIGFDGPVPTIRSGWTGPRNSTSIVSSATSLKEWSALRIWPNGVAADRKSAAAFVARNGDFRLSIADCMVLQAFPADWPIRPPVYKALGLLGNAVAPPMGYAVARTLADALA